MNEKTEIEIPDAIFKLTLKSTSLIRIITILLFLNILFLPGISFYYNYKNLKNFDNSVITTFKILLETYPESETFDATRLYVKSIINEIYNPQLIKTIYITDANRFLIYHTDKKIDKLYRGSEFKKIKQENKFKFPYFTRGFLIKDAITGAPKFFLFIKYKIKLLNIPLILIEIFQIIGFILLLKYLSFFPSEIKNKLKAKTNELIKIIKNYDVELVEIPQKYKSHFFSNFIEYIKELKEKNSREISNIKEKYKKIPLLPVIFKLPYEKKFLPVIQKEKNWYDEFIQTIRDNKKITIKGYSYNTFYYYNSIQSFYWKIFPIEKNLTGIFIGDLSDIKNINKKIFTFSVLKEILDIPMDIIKEPSRFSAYINNFFYENKKFNITFNIFYGVLNSEGNYLEFLNTGIFPIFIFHSDMERTEIINSEKKFIGKTSGDEFFRKNEIQKHRLFKNDTFLLCNKEIELIETIDKSSYDLQRIIQILANTIETPAKDVIEKIRGDFKSTGVDFSKINELFIFCLKRYEG